MLFLIAKLGCIEILVATLSTVIIKILITATAARRIRVGRWISLTIGGMAWAGRRAMRIGIQWATAVIGRTGCFCTPRFTLSQCCDFITIQSGRLGIVLLLNGHGVIVVWLTIQEFTCPLIPTDLWHLKNMCFIQQGSSPLSHQLTSIAHLPSFFPIRCLSICPSIPSEQTINAHQGLDVFPSIPNRSKYRMLRTPIVDCGFHIRSISERAKIGRTQTQAHKHTKVKWNLLAIIIIIITDYFFYHTVFSLVGRSSCRIRLVRGLAIFHSQILPTTHFNIHTLALVRSLARSHTHTIVFTTQMKSKLDSLSLKIGTESSLFRCNSFKWKIFVFGIKNRKN